MQLIKPSVKVRTRVCAEDIITNIEEAGRTCYKSEDKITKDSGTKFIKMLIARGHDSVLEHESLSVRIIADRGVLAEITRQRHNSFSVESTRYCNYSKKGLTFIIPPWCKGVEPGDYNSIMLINLLGSDKITQDVFVWCNAMYIAQKQYNELINLGWKPEEARSVLPNSLKTEIVTTANIRQWRTVFKQRTARAAHPQMREVMNDVYDQFVALGLGIFFEDIIPYREI